jgi:hypothetical protein
MYAEFSWKFLSEIDHLNEREDVKNCLRFVSNGEFCISGVEWSYSATSVVLFSYLDNILKSQAFNYMISER